MSADSAKRSLLVPAAGTTVLAAWAVMLVCAGLDLKLSQLVAPVFRPMMVAVGGVLGLGVAARLWEMLRGGRMAFDCGPECRPAEPPGAAALLRHLILLAPCVLLFFVNPLMVSRSFVDKRPFGAAPPSGGTASPVARDGVLHTDVIELLDIANDQAARGEFDGRPVKMLVQLVRPEKHTPEAGFDEFYAVRIFMFCCAADARPVGVLVKSAQPHTFKDMSWAELTGTVRFVQKEGRPVPVVFATAVTEVPPPEEFYLY